MTSGKTEEILHEAEFTSDQDSKFVDKRRSNVKSDLIEITEDKLENILLKHLQRLGTRRSWITPLSLFITTLLAILSATFGDMLGIEAPVWKAIFLLASIASFLWLIASTVLLAVNWKQSSLPYLIAIIKNANVTRSKDSEL